MSRQVLIDGYNVLQKMPALSSLKLEDGRRGLVRFIEANRPQGSLRNSITIIFDGKEEIWGTEVSAEVRILFSRGESADDLIKRMVEDVQTSDEIVLVTDDRELGYFCRTHGAQLWSVAQFLRQAHKNGSIIKSGFNRKADNGRGKSGEEKFISDKTANLIKAELSRVWLKGK